MKFAFNFDINQSQNVFFKIVKQDFNDDIVAFKFHDIAKNLVVKATMSIFRKIEFDMIFLVILKNITMKTYVIFLIQRQQNINIKTFVKFHDQLSFLF